MGDAGLKELAELLCRNNTLKRLTIEGMSTYQSIVQFFSTIGIQFTAAGMSYLCDALLVNRSLSNLRLANNALDDSCVGHLTRALKNNSTLKKLSIEGKFPFHFPHAEFSTYRIFD
jgi:hypothetical protein